MTRLRATLAPCRFHPATHDRTVIVFGPQGCGKTFNSAIIAEHFGLRSDCVHDWSPGRHIIIGHLHFTTEEGAAHAIASAFPNVRAFDFFNIPNLNLRARIGQ